MIMNLATGRSLLSQHAVHLLSIGIPVVMVVAGLAIDSVRKSRARGRDPARLRRPPLFVAAGALVAAAVVHAWVTPQHLRESLLYGTFFAGLALAQLGAAWLVAVGRSRLVVAAVALGSAAVICLWLLTRLVAIPLGPAAGETESFGALDVAASAFELVAMAGCVVALHPRVRRRRGTASPTVIPGQVLVR